MKMITQRETLEAAVAQLSRAGRGECRAFGQILPSPVLLEAMPHMQLQGDMTQVTVRVSFPGMLGTDLVAVVWFGTPGAGTPDIEPLDGDEAGYVDFHVPVAVVSANDGGTVELIAVLVRGEDQFVSEPVEVSVGAASGLPWPVPEVCDNTGVAVNPLSPIDRISGGLTVAALVVRDPRLKRGDRMASIWNVGARDWCIGWARAGAGEVRVDVPLNVLQASVGRSVEIINVFVFDSVRSAVSPPLSLEVLPVPDELLVSPRVEEASIEDSATLLVLQSFSGDATVTAQWPWMAVGQTVWLQAQGTSQSSVPLIQTLAQAQPITPLAVSEGLRVSLPRDFLLMLADDSQLIIELKVSLSGSRNEAEVEAQVCSLCILTFRIQSDLIRDLTNFYRGFMNDWTFGPAASDLRDQEFREWYDQWYWHNNTYTEYSAGVVLRKTLTNLRVGAKYRFSFRVQRINPSWATTPVHLSVTAKSPGDAVGIEVMPLSGADPGQWWTFSHGSLVPTTRTMTLEINNLNASGVGNDYDLTDITIELDPGN
jgi:hypothetical protein